MHPASSVDYLIETVGGAQSDLAHIQSGLSNKLATNEALSSKLASQLPQALNDANDELAIAASQSASKPGDADAQRRLEDALGKATELLGAAADALPNAKAVQRSLGDIEGAVLTNGKPARPTEFSGGAGYRLHNAVPASERLAQAARETGGQPPSKTLQDLAKKTDAANKAVEDVYSAMSMGGLAKTVNQVWRLAKFTIDIFRAGNACDSGGRRLYGQGARRPCHRAQVARRRDITRSQAGGRHSGQDCSRPRQARLGERSRQTRGCPKPARW